MDLLFRPLRAGEMERPPTQRDQFNNDDVELVDALVRESIQNSLDAAVQPGSELVRVCFDIRDLDGSDKTRALDHIEHELLNEHLEAAELPVFEVEGSLKVLTIEDFGTKGLEGSWDDWDERPFCDFWRRMGRSHKGGRSLGRWGLGKLVFSCASQARVFFGLTIRRDDDNPLLMGQAVLTHHRMSDGVRHDSHAFYAVEGQLGGDTFQLPERAADVIDDFRELFSLKRKNEPGLSIVVPALRENITEERICRGVLRNYFFPILFGRLEVRIGQTVINDESFAELASKLDPERFADGGLATFIEEMKATRDEDGSAQVTLPYDWAQMDMDVALGEDLETLKQRLRDGGLVVVRAPILMKRKGGEEIPSFVDAFLKQAPEDAHPLFVRQAIVLNGEQRYFPYKGRKVFAALIADDEAVSAFLGDAENPAHTNWSASAEHVTSNWRNARERLKEIRYLLRWLHGALVSAVEERDENALIGVFSLPDEEGDRGTSRKGPDARPPEIPPIERRPRVWKIGQLSDGFRLQAGTISEDDLPFSVRVQVAYDVPRGNPFQKHSPNDFNLADGGAKIDASGASVTASTGNTLTVEVNDCEFSVDVAGFDQNRDLIIAAEKVS